jgi:hypothetical protein
MPQTLLLLDYDVIDEDCNEIEMDHPDYEEHETRCLEICVERAQQGLSEGGLSATIERDG